MSVFATALTSDYRDGRLCISSSYIAFSLVAGIGFPYNGIQGQIASLFSRSSGVLKLSPCVLITLSTVRIKEASPPLWQYNSTYRPTYFIMSRCSYHQRSASDYSSLFNSGLRAISESHGRRRSMSAPPSVESLTLSSILPIRSNFYSVESSTSIQDNAASQRDAGSEPNSRTPGFRNVWKIKGVPLQLGLSRTL